MFMIYDLLTTW